MSGTVSGMRHIRIKMRWSLFSRISQFDRMTKNDYIITFYMELYEKHCGQIKARATQGLIREFSQTVSSIHVELRILVK